jgi:hypothetical protein
LPIVTIAATDATAAEPGTDTATFTISRTGDLSAPLLVKYNVSGSAGANADYTKLPASVTIPAGAASITLTVNPIDDTAVEGSETVIVTLSANKAYTVGSSNSATATIADDAADASILYLVAKGSTWNYLDDGSNQGTAWTASAFDDQSWNSGAAKFGFGMTGTATTLTAGKLTYYFRRSFNVTDPSSFTDLTLRLLRDDGAVVYLNGVEVARSNMPTGPVLYTTRASVGVSGADEKTFFESQISSNWLVSGVNVLAVEVHQVAAVSPDLGFDLQLLGNLPQ